MLDLSIPHFLCTISIAVCLLGVFPMRTHGLEQESGGNVGISGERDFRMYCANCHGEDGHGEGPKIFGLSRPPPDLTTLATRNDGVFPKDRLARIIDGREDIKVHEDREMPVWGQWFEMEAEEGLGGAEGDEGRVQQRIENLIDFLEMIQR
jgi:hypothetical protein